VLRRFFTAEEDALVVAKEVPDASLAERLGRSIASIRVRRSKLVHSSGPSEELRQKQREHSKKWRKKNPKSRNRRRAKNYALGALHNMNSRKPWTPEDDQAITAADKPTDRELAKTMNRTVRAIQTRRGKLKRNKSQ